MSKADIPKSQKRGHFYFPLTIASQTLDILCYIGYSDP